MRQHADTGVIGAGIAGLAHAYAAARHGQRVVLFERHQRSVGASIRNFGLVWPIGVPEALVDRALFGRSTWLDLASKAGFTCQPNGSLLLAYRPDEREVLAEFSATMHAQHLGCQLLTAAQVIESSPAVRLDGLLGGLWSPNELSLDPREALGRLPHWLAKEYGVELRFGTGLSYFEMPHIETATEQWRVDRVYVCGGADFETLFPAVFAASGITRCKLQMMRTVPQPAGWRFGPTLGAGLTIARYETFVRCSSLTALKQRLACELPEYVREGIHVLLSQNAAGEVLIGDSHEYGLTIDPFDEEAINQRILSYLATFAQVPSLEIAERWHGVYPRLEGQIEFVAQPEPGVTIVCDTTDLGMTLSFGLAEEDLRDP